MNIHSLIEVLLLSNSNPLTQKILDDVLGEINKKYNLPKIVKELNDIYVEQEKGYHIALVSGGYKFFSNKDYYIYIDKLNFNNKKNTFSQPAIETLSIIAYKQPITRLEIEHLRGVDCTGVIKNLLEKGMVIVKGRQEGLGRALLYATSKKFLEKFGLNNLKDLPSIEDMEDIIESEVKK